MHSTPSLELTCVHSQVWDVTTGQCDQTLVHHSGKVQAVSWNAAQASVLLSGGFDKTACMVRLLGASYLKKMRFWRHKTSFCDSQRRIASALPLGAFFSRGRAMSPWQLQHTRTCPKP